MADPQGFTVPTAEELAREFRIARYNDSTNPDGRLVSVERFTNSVSAGYRVTEEARTNVFSNDSIQSVSIAISRSAPAVSQVSLATDNHVNGSRTTLAATNDGHITLSTRTDNGVTASLDITNEAAANGITAAQIREMQRTISYDGEVDRVEQQQIISIIDRAQSAVRQQAAVQ